MKRATFANGIEWVYDPNVNAPATHYSDADGVNHKLLSEVDVPDDTEPGFRDTNAPAAPAPVQSFPGS